MPTAVLCTNKTNPMNATLRKNSGPLLAYALLLALTALSLLASTL